MKTSRVSLPCTTKTQVSNVESCAHVCFEALSDASYCLCVWGFNIYFKCDLIALHKNSYSLLYVGAWTQLWMVFDYHPRGSLYDFLSKNVIKKGDLCKLTVSLASGLEYLHHKFKVGESHKPAIAHRDLKCRNILVKLIGLVALLTLGWPSVMIHRKIWLRLLTILNKVRYYIP